MASMHKAAFFEQYGRGIGNWGSPAESSLCPSNEKAVSQKRGGLSLVRMGALFPYDRNFGAFWNVGIAKIQRRIFHSHSFQGRATDEDSPADARYTVWNRDACQGFTPQEGLLADARDAIWNGYAFQGKATHEGITADALDAVWNRYACQG